MKKWDAPERIGVRDPDFEAKEEALINRGFERYTTNALWSLYRRPFQDHVKATKAAKRLATERGVDLSKIKGTSKSGTITKADVERLSAPASSSPDAEPGTPQSP